MSTRTNATYAEIRRLGLVALGLGTLLAAGCVTTPFMPTFPASGTYTFTIAFVKGCPVSADVDYKNCDASAPKDCARVRRGETVVFVSSPPGTSFDVYFSPSKPERAPSGSTSIVIDSNAPRKRYEFSVVSGTCKPLDPWIIVE